MVEVLVSGGGLAIKIDGKNTNYHVNYGDGTHDKDEMTGRSFGEAPSHKASDASDKFYLNSLEKYVRGNRENSINFYRSLLQIVVNSDPTGFDQISPEGQTVASDFLSVYTAEQVRHLMADLRRHPWDEALLEVTLLAAFHAGQNKIQVMYNGKLTENTNPQTSGCDPKDARLRPASLTDYWQFSRSPDPKSCRRSGINVTRKDFRALEKEITKRIYAQKPELVKKVESHFQGIKITGNVFADFSSYVINNNTPSLIADGDALVEDFLAFLQEVQRSAEPFSVDMMSNQPDGLEE